MSILSVDRLKPSSPSAMVDGIFSYIKADYNYYFFFFSVNGNCGVFYS